jgi:polar amino acid transport system substrate-binding protein
MVVAAVSVALALTACSSPAQPDEQESTPGSGAAPDFNQAAHDALPDRIKDAGVLKIGLSADTPPWATKPDNEIVGIVPDLADGVGGILGVEIELVGMAFPGLVPGLQAEQIDAAWTVLTDTAEREEAMDLVSYMRTSSDFLVQAGNPAEITGIDESLCGTVIGVLRSSLYIPAMEEQSEKCTADGMEPVRIDQFDDNKAAVLNVQSDKADAFVGITGILRSVAAGSNGTFETAGANLYPGYLGIATSPGTGTAEAIKLALIDLIESGAYDEVLTSHEAESDALSADEIVVNGVGSGQLK